MKKLLIAAMVAAGLAVTVPVHADRVYDPTPTRTFSDNHGNSGYVSVDENGVKACNENEETPAGDDVTGYAWVNPNGEANRPENGKGNEFVGSGDRDGNSDNDPTNGDENNDCP